MPETGWCSLYRGLCTDVFVGGVVKIANSWTSASSEC